MPSRVPTSQSLQTYPQMFDHCDVGHKTHDAKWQPSEHRNFLEGAWHPRNKYRDKRAADGNKCHKENKTKE